MGKFVCLNCWYQAKERHAGLRNEVDYLFPYVAIFNLNTAMQKNCALFVV